MNDPHSIPTTVKDQDDEGIFALPDLWAAGACMPRFRPPFAVMAGFYSGQARTLAKQYWNPAHGIRLAGIGCAMAGVLVWSMVDILIIWRILNPPYH